VQVSQQIVNMLYAYRQAHHVFAHASLGQLFSIELAVRGGGGVCRQRLRIANIDQTREELQRVEKACTRSARLAITGFQAKRQDA
jgi:hypothetical protein